ncbi:DUF4823 domain-containing protein [Pseudomonas sp. L-22-4S-12]|uniref:DUF4823 domain-containing protein n=1 Tax=Pseudomonas sp. L-22-4S-12 TaxID=2610893 RepID=UPI00211552DE|nr:DUF4823 domain-containing protein [Pseudomonas sp. L-22-4S-12]
MKGPTITALLLMLGGCMDSTQFIKEGDAGLPARSSFYVAQPADGMYGAKPYPGSGKLTSAIIRQALQNNAQEAVAASRVERREQALAAARQGGHSYLVFPTILHWEDRATEWNFMRDKVQVKVELVDVFSGHSESSAIIAGKSGIATLGGDHPQDLLPEPIEQYFQTLLGRAAR